ncbi:hypothetical protein PMG11_10497 [Penicillium brasilianum]|uniref:Uncharacterized protein n=1 Tax=Penicillium brasilianum TaxID=104259 RepID=A0A0F7U198_PENBI|nr:hypothetical protein PMG11_10497 [Penicillium brasilianum]
MSQAETVKKVLETVIAPLRAISPHETHECDDPVHEKSKVYAHTWSLEGFALVDTAKTALDAFGGSPEDVEEASGKPWNVGWSCSPLDDRVD